MEQRDGRGVLPQRMAASCAGSRRVCRDHEDHFLCQQQSLGRKVVFSVKNTGTTVIDIDVWAFWWNWTLGPALETILEEFGVPAVGGAVVTTNGTAMLDVAGSARMERTYRSNPAIAGTSVRTRKP